MNTIEERTNRSLVRLGIAGVQVKHLGDGRLALSVPLSLKGDSAMIIAIARSVQGVVAVTLERMQPQTL